MPERITAAAGLATANTRVLERAQSIAAIFPDSPGFRPHHPPDLLPVEGLKYL